MWLDGRVVYRVLDFRSAGRGFKSWPPPCRVQPGKVVCTQIDLSPSSVIGTSQWAVSGNALHGWVDNRRSGIAQAMRHSRLWVVLHLRAQGLGEGYEHQPTLSSEVQWTLPLHKASPQCRGVVSPVKSCLLSVWTVVTVISFPYVIPWWRMMRSQKFSSTSAPCPSVEEPCLTAKQSLVSKKCPIGFDL